MYIEERLNSIDAKLDSIFARLLTANAIGQDQSGIAGAGADPVVAPKVDAAIEAAAPAAPVKRGRGRPANPPKTEAPTTAAPAAPPALVVTEPDPFALSAPSAPAEKPRTLEEVRAALAVYQANTTQAEAIKLFKDVTKVETVSKLLEAAKTEPALFGKLFKAAVPADKLVWNDVRAVLVKANERKEGSGMEVLKANGANKADELSEDKYIAVILAAHAVK